MSEYKCTDCGAELKEGMTECPVCGCPIAVVEEKPQKAKISPIDILKHININALISLVLGIVIIFMGVSVKNTEISIDTYNAKQFDADYASFGADFYTYIYKASDIIVDELNDINGGIESLSESMNMLANVIYKPVGTMIIAVGLGVVALACIHIKKEH